MIELALHTALREGARQFQLDVELASSAAVLGFYGPSGAGKSLSLQAVAGLLPLQRGRIVVQGECWFDSARGIRRAVPERRVGYLFQHYALFPHLSVRANVGFGLTRWYQRLSRADGERVDELLAAFGLSELAHARPDRLSGGQRQRVALARALAARPSLLLLDEPFAALNPMLRAQLRAELKRVRAQFGVPALLVTHDVDDLLALADEAYLFDEGRVQRRVDLRAASAEDREAAGLAPPPDDPETARKRKLLHA
ncbi:ATP-binding cassette domain-containing protein [Inhella sp.]|uniref:ATP-binding cassette domain-containing protein n=1 Tax=Inhella sp. TaxID=1921806 RepID=UPI0035B497A1